MHHKRIDSFNNLFVALLTWWCILAFLTDTIERARRDDHGYSELQYEKSGVQSKPRKEQVTNKHVQFLHRIPRLFLVNLTHLHARSIRWAIWFVVPSCINKR